MSRYTIYRYNQILIFSILVFLILFYTRDILIPIAFSVMLAMLMSSVADWLETKGAGRVLSTGICILILVIFTGLIGLLVGVQVDSITEDYGMLQQKLQKYLDSVQAWIEKVSGVSHDRQIAIFKKQAGALVSSAGSFFKTFLTGFTTISGGVILCLVFTVLFLNQREKYHLFFADTFGGSNRKDIEKILGEVSKVARKYLAGRLLSIIILTVAYWIGLVIVGIKNSFVLSAIAALLTIVPYVGTVVGGFFPFFMALVTEDSVNSALYVIVVITVIQTIDNYFVEPYIVGGEVNLSAFASILIIIIGGYMWGVAGMILFIPMLGIFKIICDHVPALKPLSKIIGDEKETGAVKAIFNLIRKITGK
jgi:predicted PurR-regulated permease PerM